MGHRSDRDAAPGLLNCGVSEENDALILKNWPYYEEVLEADRFINLPIAKHHSAAGLTDQADFAGQNRADAGLLDANAKRHVRSGQIVTLQRAHNHQRAVNEEPPAKRLHIADL